MGRPRNPCSELTDTGQKKSRTCLRCGDSFMSSWAGNRICGRKFCQTGKEYEISLRRASVHVKCFD